MSNEQTSSPGQVTLLLHRASAGGPAAEHATSELLPIVYGELRALAASFFGSPGQTLQPTAIVHEAYLKLVQAPNQGWEGRRHFIAVASKAMRQVLVNHARDRRAQKRGGGGSGILRVTLSDSSPIAGLNGLEAVDLLALEEALAGLERDFPEQSRIVELKFFGGLTNEETARVLGVGLHTVEREWRMAKAELRLRLGEANA